MTYGDQSLVENNSLKRFNFKIHLVDAADELLHQQLEASGLSYSNK